MEKVNVLSKEEVICTEHLDYLILICVTV